MPFRVYCNSRRTAAEFRRRYGLKFPGLTLVSAEYRGKKNGLSGLVLAKQLADRRKIIIIYGQPSEEDANLVTQLQKMPTVRFLEDINDARALAQADNELRAPWRPHNALPNPRARRTKNP